MNWQQTYRKGSSLYVRRMTCMLKYDNSLSLWGRGLIRFHWVLLYQFGVSNAIFSFKCTIFVHTQMSLHRDQSWSTTQVDQGFVVPTQTHSLGQWKCNNIVSHLNWTYYSFLKWFKKWHQRPRISLVWIQHALHLIGDLFILEALRPWWISLHKCPF